jgi:hypothetical protein
MKMLSRLACLGLLSLLSLTRAMAQNPFECGNLHQRVCQHTDWGRLNLATGENRACEVDLREKEGYCVNDRRNGQGVRRAQWAAWALEQQLLSIGSNNPLNYLSWPAAHEAYTNPAQGFPAAQAQQSLSLTDQLNAGARLLDLDVAAYALGASSEALRLCRAPNGGECAQPGGSYRLFGNALLEVANWVDANPGQIVVLRLNNDQFLGRRITLVYDEVQRLLGARVFRAPAGTPARWPTPGEMLTTGKSVLVAQFGAPPDGSSTWVWSASGLGQGSDRVSDQNLEGCVANDGMDLAQRSTMKPLSWWDVAESATGGLLTETAVRKAVRCGVSAVGMNQVDPADARIAAMVWSWAEGDWGRNGAAHLNVSGRWSSAPETQMMPVACAVRREANSSSQDRAWRITTRLMEWNINNATGQCTREFGSNYEFAAPENGYQNDALARVAAGRTVWLRHKAGDAPSLSLSARKLVFRMNPGGPAPSPQGLQLSAADHLTVRFLAEPGLPVVTSTPSATLTGTTTVLVSLGGGVTALPAGVHQGRLDIVAGGRTTSVEVELTVRAAPEVTVTADPATVEVGRETSLRLDFAGGQNAVGEYSLFRVANGALELLRKGVLTAQSASTAITKVTLTNLAQGTHTMVVTVMGDARNLAASSKPVTVTVLPRLVATPALLDWQMFVGGALPTGEVTLTGLGTSPTVTSSCAWARGGVLGASLRVQALEAVRQLAMGTHRCELTVADRLSGQGLGRLVLPVTLRVQAPLTASPAHEMRLVGDEAAEGRVQLTTPLPAGVALTATASVPWLQVVPLGAMRAPGTFRIVVTATALPVGRHRGEVVFRSEMTPEVRVPVLFDRVRPTLIDTYPANMNFTVDGSLYTGSASFLWTPDSVHQLVMIPQSAPNERQVPRAWETVAGMRPGATTELRASAQGGWITGHFETWYRLQRTAGPGGTLTIRSDSAPDGDFYRSLARLEIIASPHLRFRTARLSVSSGSDSYTGNLGRILWAMTGPVVVAVTFEAQAAERVEIVSNVPGVKVSVDGVLMQLPATLYWYPRSEHTLFAQTEEPNDASSKWEFDQWRFESPSSEPWTTGTQLNSSFAMPASSLRIEARYKLVPSKLPSANAGTAKK